MILDDGACVHWPDEDPGAPIAEVEGNAHRDKQGHLVSYDQIPRRPDRPADYDAYRYPVPCVRDCVVSGYDLDRPDDLQRRGRRLHQVGHGAVDLVQPKGTPVTLTPLEHQRGEAEVVFVGPLFGSTVITQHMLYEGGQTCPYLVLFGHLDSAAPGLRSGTSLKDGDVIGWVGDTGSPELVHLHFEIRRVRDGVDVRRMQPQAMISNDISVVCDPRNVLPLR
jgi:murein DD-endopeptidase MepM/ murein hydrolase activator NlpD